MVGGCCDPPPAGSEVGHSIAAPGTSDPSLSHLLNNSALRLCGEPELSRMGLSSLEVWGLLEKGVDLCQGCHRSQQRQNPGLWEPPL